MTDAHTHTHDPLACRPGLSFTLSVWIQSREPNPCWILQKILPISSFSFCPLMLLWEAERGSGGDEILITDTAPEIAPLLLGEDMKNTPKGI